MRTRFDVRLRWWNREVLGLEGLGEVQDASEQLLGVLGLWAGAEEVGEGGHVELAGEGLGLGIGVFRFAESGLEEGGAWAKRIRAGFESVGRLIAPWCANLGPICESTAISIVVEEEGCKLSDRRCMIELWV